MPDNLNPNVESAEKATKRSAGRTTRNRSPSAADEKSKPAGRKPRARKAPETVVVQASESAVVLGPAPEEAAVTVVAVQQAAEALDTVRARHYELIESVAEAERRVAELRRQADALGDLSELRREIDETQRYIEESRRHAAEIRREAAGAAGTFKAIGEQMAGTRAEVEAVRRAADEAAAAARAAREQAADLEAAGKIRTTRPAAAEPEPLPAPSPAADTGRPPVAAITDIPEVEPIPAEELAHDARARLIRYLNDAAAVEREQAGLLQTLAGSTDDPDLRAEFERHRAVGEEHRGAVDARVRALGGEPGGGRGLLGQIVTRVWDALQKPRESAADPVEDMLKALSAAEFEAGMYLAVHALARAVGDAETAELVASHHRRERAFADRLRSRITPAAVRAVRS